MCFFEAGLLLKVPVVPFSVLVGWVLDLPVVPFSVLTGSLNTTVMCMSVELSEPTLIHPCAKSNFTKAYIEWVHDGPISFIFMFRWIRI